MAKIRAVAIIVFLALAVWGTAPAAADLVTGEPGGESTAPPAYAMVSSEHHYFSIGYWENIIEAICQPGGFCQSFAAQPGEQYTLRVDFTGHDPGIEALEVKVAGADYIYELAALNNSPIILPFAARQPTETLELAPYRAPSPVPVPPTLLLLGAGLSGLAIFPRRGKGLRAPGRFPEN
jgi:hypothetical protein